MPTINELKKQFSLSEANHSATVVAGAGNMPMVVIRNSHATAHIYLHGAHLTHFQPHDAEPVLWLSQQSRFHSEAPIRGGVPICWPWFGAHDTNKSAPAHGFARHNAWDLKTLQAEPDGSTTITLTLQDSDATRAIWPHAFQLTLTVHVGKELDMHLITKNTGAKPFTYAEALHTYIAVSDVREIAVNGLAGVTYVDKMDNLNQHTQDAAIAFSGETDRVYLNTQSTCTINDPTGKRLITISKTGSLATVVWNPWLAKAAAMSDFGAKEWPQMVCIETANVLAHTRTLAPKSSHTMQAKIGVQAG